MKKPNLIIKKITIHRIKNNQITPRSVTDQVAIEKDITLVVDGIEKYTLLCTPQKIKQLAIGFLYSKGIINDVSRIRNFLFKKDIIKVTLNKKSSLAKNIKLCRKTLQITTNDLFDIVHQLQTQQQIFAATGGVHAAGIFDINKKIIASAEDVARHNALDKVIGECLLNGRNIKSCGAVLSSRITFEMVNKAARAGLEIIIAVSAPSSLAIKTAKKYNITLCGFVRNGTANIYTGKDRIK
jgi:formate dehydrogenase assembly factor FdhD